MRARDLRGGGAGVEDDGLAVANERDGGLGDAHLLRVMLQLLDVQRLVGVRHAADAPPWVRVSAPADFKRRRGRRGS